jgi:hypothetical protein
MLVGVSDERAGARCLQISSFACWMPAAPTQRYDGIPPVPRWHKYKFSIPLV